ncbi:NAD-dependent protein deacylase [Halalkalibacterium halodurans]|uniref:NAD-dependent protein deacetylase n=1 Tax=Halalkalibacterium halodurans (strain ATCC BAA-125 / DSM 18197 / FERM 7344 / JCM 9153 / C-125) TaxID=272558 RepID=NPD_HALH5|nr:NAD-dependent protein deacylase [Halalkalibacterium halodurans]Q9KEE5.1 RecName: Full=NAD-dependent protein deacetylase; AltName: Full=Regulatory protein SIR2 homolog [Halalkalibacterium halodurans C-125]MDY7221406.1 NAD-dependent protein deacylase [Halalkalibacterium halodurans]MDY7240645.1 NAD-dependent protein deacylase [Halalkalibacterium halodurans]MED4082933.1 NAD-dependent protein deacylase [Halalkalibacterium halodurans]MED4086764.1 NAD-dependent protein deacylase [Halalkalibacteriu
MLTTWLTEAKKIVIFTGAGMSTESGVPDFRSSRGLWQGKNPEALASVDAMDHNREAFIDFYRMRIEGLQGVRPHKGYDVLAAWEKELPITSIITQNTDGLHEQAGSEVVLPLHGSIQRLYCVACGQRYDVARYITNEPYCSCGGFIRPAVVLFGEMLNTDTLALAERHTKEADLFLVLGSSLVVSPANLFPKIAKECGAKLVIVNHDETPLDPLADLVIQDQSIGTFLEETNRALQA